MDDPCVWSGELEAGAGEDVTQTLAGPAHARCLEAERAAHAIELAKARGPGHLAED
jgi:hypothetical protein